MIIELELEMRKAADELNFEKAIYMRERIIKLKQTIG
jgi:excinuclease UvrABC helicase subunit UvrB